MNRLITIAAVSLTVLISGCAIVTTYGQEPKKLENNTYKFKLYYNITSTQADIDKKAKEIISEIKTKNNHSDCKNIRQDTSPNTGSQTIIYTVKCT